MLNRLKRSIAFIESSDSSTSRIGFLLPTRNHSKIGG
jgi:hypothetical protein